jgi:DNA ligase (NAD+)
MLNQLRNQIDKAAQAYYRGDGIPIMTDAEYDGLISQLRELDENDIRLSRVGIPYSPEELRTKIKHPIPMGSLDNTEDGINGLGKWLNDMISVATDGLSICASLKVDGSSIRLRYQKGVLVEAASRGNGEVGEDITANVANFSNIPIVLADPIDIDVRGEAILYLEDYKQIRSRQFGCDFDEIGEKDRSNPRNIGNGIISRDDGTDSDKMRFLAFNAATDQESDTEISKLELINNLGFEVVPHRLCNSIDQIKDYYQEVSANRDSLPFEIDGLVVCINEMSQQKQHVSDDVKTRLRPKYARAIKFTNKSSITTLLDVELSIGHTGAIVPTAILEQVRIGGVNVTHSLLNNWDEINRLGVCIGDRVEVVLAGDIIPKIIRVAEPSHGRKTIVEPIECPSCGAATTRENRGKQGAVTYCSNKQCSEVMLRKIDKWIGSSKSGVGILGIGDVILKTLWDQGIVRDPADLYVITLDQIKDLELDGGGRIGKPRAIEILNNIRNNSDLGLDVFLGSLGIELLGKRRVKILQKLSDGQLDKLDDWLDDGKLASLQLPGFGDAIRQAIRDGIDENRDLIAKLLSNGVTIKNEGAGKVEDKTFSGMTFCFTGTRECIDQVVILGGEIKSSVAKSKPTPDFLVQKDPLSQSSKSKNAEANGHTKIISVDFLRKCLKGEASLSS